MIAQKVADLTPEELQSVLENQVPREAVSQIVRLSVKYRGTLAVNYFNTDLTEICHGAGTVTEVADDRFWLCDLTDGAVLVIPFVSVIKGWIAPPEFQQANDH